MTRKEQILNEAIDYSFVEENFLEYDDYGNVCDDRDFIQKAFEEGAKWADKTMIDKACQWLMKYFVLDHEGMSPSGFGVFEYMFRKAMEE